MLPALLLATTLASNPAPATAPMKLAAPSFGAVNIDPEAASFYTDHVAQRLRRLGLQVVTAREIALLLGIERQKQLLGCSEDASECMIELANALGAEATMMGDIGRFEDVYQVNVKVLSSSNGRVLVEHSARVEGDRALLEALDETALVLARTLNPKANASTTSTTEIDSPRSGPRAHAWIPAAGGLAFGAAGTWAMLTAKGRYELLTGGLQVSNAEDVALEGKRFQTLGVIGLGLGAAALVSAGVMFFWPESDVQPQVAIGPEGAGISLVGVLP